MKTFLILLFSLALIGCSPQATAIVETLPQENLAPTPTQEDTPAPTPATVPSITPQVESGRAKGEELELTIVEMAVRDLAFRLKIDLNLITVTAIERMDWPDGGLGCPLEGFDYPQAVTPGYRIKLEAVGEIYTYHTNTELAYWLCQDGAAQLPLIPVIPGEIDDGIPWMPVDPLPTASEGIIIADPDPVK